MRSPTWPLVVLCLRMGGGRSDHERLAVGGAVVEGGAIDGVALSSGGLRVVWIWRTLNRLRLKCPCSVSVTFSISNGTAHVF